MSFFDDSQNPFADPSVRNATQSAEPATIDFNPFESDANKTIAAKPNDNADAESNWPSTAVGFQPASGSTLMSEDAPPSYTQAPSERISTEELERRQRELELKAAEIQRREEVLALQSSGTGPSNNWPPLPACCPVKSCYYQDFDVEIGAPYRSLVRLGYYATLGHFGVYFLNVVIAFVYFIVTITSPCNAGTQVCGGSGTTFGLTILWFLLFSPAAYACWFRPLYKAFKSDSSVNFFWFFLVSFAQIIVDVVWILGFPSSGSVGFINGLAMMGTNTAMGAIMVTIGCLSGLLAVLDSMLLIRVHRLYRSTGASFEKARQELTQGAFSTDVVRGAVSAGVQSAVAGNSATTSGGAPRF